MLVLCGLPLLFMELIAGQYARRGPIGALGRMCPLLKGTAVYVGKEQNFVTICLKVLALPR